MSTPAPLGCVDRGTLAAAYLRAQLGGDRREALRLILEDGLGRGLTCDDVHRVIREAQTEIGRLWQRDEISIAQEHMATAISQVVLSHVYQHAEAPVINGKKVLVACVEGELHEFPARLVADALDLAGFVVRYLGASVPTSSLARMLDAEKPDLVVLSTTMMFNVPQLRAAVRQVREHSPAVPIAVGGSACVWSPGLVQELGADIGGGDADELVTRARERLGVCS